MKPNILVVEDSILTQAVLTALFESLGFQVKGLDNGDDVLPYLNKNKADIIILDFELPGLRGDQIYSKLQDCNNLKNIPVIPFSGHADQELFGKMNRKSISKLSEAVRGRNPNQSKYVNEELIDKVTSLLFSSGKDIPEGLAKHYSKNKKVPKEGIRDYVKSKF